MPLESTKRRFQIHVDDGAGNICSSLPRHAKNDLVIDLSSHRAVGARIENESKTKKQCIKCNFPALR